MVQNQFADVNVERIINPMHCFSVHKEVERINKSKIFFLCIKHSSVSLQLELFCESRLRVFVTVRPEMKINFFQRIGRIVDVGNCFESGKLMLHVIERNTDSVLNLLLEILCEGKICT